MAENNNNNSSSVIVLQGADGELFKINKKDLVWDKYNHKHHFVPDFTDETDDYVAVKCAKCPVGRLMQKDGKDFMDWLDEHRAKA